MGQPGAPGPPRKPNSKMFRPCRSPAASVPAHEFVWGPVEPGVVAKTACATSAVGKTNVAVKEVAPNVTPEM